MDDALTDSGSGQAPALWRAEALLDLNRPVEAEAMARRLVASDPTDAAAFVVLSGALSQQGRGPEALENAREATRLSPEDALVWGTLADRAIEVEDATLARDAARRAVSLAPHSWVAQYTLGHALLTGPRPAPREALVHANEAVRLAPHSASAHNLAGWCCSDLGLEDEARRAYERALEIDPSYALAMNNLGALDIDGGRFAHGAQHVRRALATDPQLHEGQQNLDALVMGLVWKRTGLLLAGGVVLLFLEAATAGPESAAVRAVTAVVVLAAAVALAVRTARQAPGSTWAWLVRTGRSRVRPLLLVGLVLALLTAFVAYFGFAPHAATHHILGLLLPLRVIFALTAGAGIRRWWRRRRASRR